MGMAASDGIHYGIVDVHCIRNAAPIIQLGTRATLTPWQRPNTAWNYSGQALRDGPVFVNNIHAWLTGFEKLKESDRGAQDDQMDHAGTFFSC